MDKVLIVDNERENLNKVRQGFKDLHHFELITATNVKSAVDKLRSSNLSVLATSIHFPQKDGLELLAFMTRNFPSIPCIIMLDETDPKPWFSDRTGHTGVLYFLKKPFSFGRLASAIFVGLNLRDEGQTRNGMNMKNFLPLISIAGKTCRLEVRSGNREKGFFYFEKGRLLNARFDDMEGDEAAKRIAGWQGVQLAFSPLSHENRKQRTKTDLLTLARASWEKGARPKQENHQEKDRRQRSFERRGSSRLEEAMNKHADILRTVKGYKGLAIISSEGRVLASDVSSGTEISFTDMAAVTNNIYTDCSMHWSRKGLGRCRALSLHTQQGIIIMQGTDFYTAGNYRFLAFIAEEGNAFFVQTQLKNLIPRILSEIS
ncbi:MAG: response regulator [Desulfobacterales bacterium]|nr:response regulator [Desulfobacterales bacterium]